MERNARLILVSTFILLTALAIFMFYRWIQEPEESDARQQRMIEFAGSVSGLSVGSEVRYLGVSIGRVLDIDLNSNHVGRVDVTMATDQPLPASTQLIAVLEPLGITGLSLIELQNRDQGMEIFDVSPEVIPGFPSIVSQLSGSAGRIANTIEQSLEKLTRILDENSMDDLDETLRQTRKLSQNLAAASERFDSLLDSASNIGNELESALPEFRAAARQLDNEVLPAVNAAGQSLEQASDAISGMFESNEQELDQLIQRELPTLIAVSDELADTLREVNRLIGNIHAEPGTLLFGEQVKEVEIPHD